MKQKRYQNITIKPDTSSDQLKWWVGAGVVWLMILGAELSGLLLPVKRISQVLVSPVRTTAIRVVQLLPQAEQLARRLYKAEVAIRDLEQRYNLALAQLSRLEGVEAENAQLRALIENTDRKLLSTVITQPVTSLSRPSIALDPEYDFQPGMVVLVNQQVVGRISQLKPTQAELSLLHESTTQPLLVKTDTGVQGVIVGTGRGIKISEVNPNQQLEVGQKVVTLRQPGVPADILVGTIQEVDQDPASPVLAASISQSASFYESYVVEVVLP